MSIWSYTDSTKTRLEGGTPCRVGRQPAPVKHADLAIVKRYLVVEPSCTGFEHARFNSAFLATLACASPGSSIHFLSETDHLRQVHGFLQPQAEAGPDISFGELNTHWPAPMWRRYQCEKDFVKFVLGKASEEKCDFVIFASVTSSMIIALKNHLSDKDEQQHVLAIPHSVLSGVLRRSKRLWNWPLDITSALVKPTPSNLHFIALSKTILGSVARQFGTFNWHHMDHPYIFDSPTSRYVRPPRPPLRFGLFGAVRSGFLEYCGLARKIKEEHYAAEFDLIGHLSAQKQGTSECLGYIDRCSRAPISYQEYAELAQNIHFAVWLSEPRLYEYTASTTMLDILNFSRPGLYLRNRLVEENFGKLGDIGYLCEDLADMESRLRRILEEFPSEDYAFQIENIERNKIRFSPTAIATDLKANLPELF